MIHEEFSGHKAHHSTTLSVSQATAVPVAQGTVCRGTHGSRVETKVDTTSGHSQAVGEEKTRCRSAGGACYALQRSMVHLISWSEREVLVASAIVLSGQRRVHIINK